MDKIKVIGFDADDTLWVNEPYFQELEQQFCRLMADYLPSEVVSKELFKTEIQNMELYGYGAKAFILSVIETAIKASEGKVPATVIQQIIGLGKELINHDIELLDGIELLTANAAFEPHPLFRLVDGDIEKWEILIKPVSLIK